jgi:UDP-glucose 6-dehydrogenase
MSETKKVLIVGYGEIGKPMYQIVKGVYSECEWLDVQEKTVTANPDVLHIAFPENEHRGFVASCVKYIERFSPKLALIESTVSPGTTLEVHEKTGKKLLLCHSPVRGNINEGIKKGLLQYTKFIGPISKEAGEKANEYYRSLDIRTHVCSSPIETELAKIFETTYRGLMMSWFQEIHRICQKFDADYNTVVEFLASTEEEGKQVRPVFHPGVIGGHCIIPNAEKLLAAYPSPFAQALLDSNRKRAKELEK